MECVIAQGGSEQSAADAGIGKRIDRHCQGLGLPPRPTFRMCVLSPPLRINGNQAAELAGILRESIVRTAADLRKEGILSKEPVR